MKQETNTAATTLEQVNALLEEGLAEDESDQARAL